MKSLVKLTPPSNMLLKILSPVILAILITIGSGFANAQVNHATTNDVRTPIDLVGDSEDLFSVFWKGTRDGRWFYPESYQPKIDYSKQETDWGVMLVSFTDKSSGISAEEPAIPIPARMTASGWEIAFPSEANYSSLLQNLPESVLSKTVRRSYLPK
ncbi:MAG: hypothetical protein WBD79_06845, partial [Anaerolineae bacterium]